MIPPMWLLIPMCLVRVGSTLHESSFFSHTDTATRTYPCALIHWFSKIGEEPDVNTGMWQVKPDFDAEGEALYAVIHI